MNSEIERLFIETADLDPAARQRYLDEHCGSPKLRAAVEQLLRFDLGSEEFIKAPLNRLAEHAGMESPANVLSQALDPTAIYSRPGVEKERTGDPAISFQIGDVIGGYEVISMLGAGGMGRVYKVRNLISDRTEAAKILIPDLQTEPQLADRFIQEIKVQARLSHPYIAALHTALRIGNQLVMVMELLEGTTLEARLRQFPIPVQEGVSYICQVLEALSYAHGQGVVHRDIKPGNIMLTPGKTVKLMDFGVARVASAGRLTIPGTAIGSAAYMPPEQVRGATPDPRSDLYSVGVTLYEITTGARPFRGDNDYAIMSAQLNQAPRPPRELNSHLPHRLSEIILHSLAKNPADRFQTADEFRAALLALDRDPANPIAAPSQPAAAIAALAPARCFVGRKTELAELITAYESAAGGAGKFICLSGEPGLGKTALAQAFVAQLSEGLAPFAMANGHCSERLSEAEPYRSIFEAIESLLSGPEGSELRPLLLESAPSWAAQVTPGVKTGPASKERMIREATSFLRQASRTIPIVLFLEDLQWADVSTLDLLLDLSSRLDSSRILTLGTYRPHDRGAGKTTFHQVKLQLHRRGCFREIALDFLTLEEVQAYLDLEFPQATFPAGLGLLLHSNTGGNPLFLVELVQFLKDLKFIQCEPAGWSLTRAVSELADVMPQSVRAMIQAKIEQLSDQERGLLLAASVQGVDFDSAVLAKALDLEAADVEDRLEASQRDRGIVRNEGEIELPDGALTVRYRFVQDIEHEALYALLKPARRASLSAAIALSTIALHGPQAGPAAARIALLFEAARKFDSAAEYFRLAAVNAANVGSMHEAVTLARKGLYLLYKIPEDADRQRRELAIRMTLGAQLTLSNFASPEVRANYLRACELCTILGDSEQFAPAQWGLWLCELAGARLSEARLQAGAILQAAGQNQDPQRLVAAHWAMGTTLGNLGEMVEARFHFERGIELYNPRDHEYYATVYGFDPGVACRVELGGRFLWILGYPDEAVRTIHEAQDLARQLAHPPSVCFALAFEAVLHQLRGDAGAALDCAGKVLKDPRSPANMRAWAALCQGWALAARGDLDAGIQQIRESLAAHQAIGSSMGRPHFLTVLAETLGRAGDAQGGLAAAGEGFDLMKTTGQRYYEAELSRVRGELFAKSGDTETADRHFQEALRISRKQSARALELRAATSIAELWRSQGKCHEAEALMARVHGSYPANPNAPLT